MTELVPDYWRDLDDTLADGPSPATVPDEAKAWLAEQRLMHGLLRSLNTADAGAREGRVVELLARIDSSQAVVARRHWTIVGVAATLLATLVIWFSMPERLPTAAAAVDRIVSEIDREIDRRYRVSIRTQAGGKMKDRHSFWLVTRPGMRFRIEGRFALPDQKVTELRIGSDGNELWLQSVRGRYRQAVPLADRSKLLGSLDDVLDVVYLDVHTLINKLPENFEVRVVGRETTGEGRKLLRIHATGRRGGRASRLRSVWLLCDESTGMVHHLGMRRADTRGVQRVLRLDYLGEEPGGQVDYQKPW